MTSAVERDELIAKIKQDFDDRLARIAEQPDEWVTFIESVVQFGARYSLNNQVLLLMQAEERGMQPRYFLPYGGKDGRTGWRGVGRHVRKGERGFKVWTPVHRRPTEEQAKQMEASGRKVPRDEHGRPRLALVGFRLANTFDVSQTEGEPFEVPSIQRRRQARIIGGQRAELLDGDDPTGAFDDVVKLIKDEGYTFDLVPPGSDGLGDANGRTTRHGTVKRVRVRDDISGAHRIKTTVHELAHILCGHLDDSADPIELHRGRYETEAESIAHIVCRMLGLDTRGYSDAYVLEWADGDIELIKNCADTILHVTKRILKGLDPESDATISPTRLSEVAS